MTTRGQANTADALGGGGFTKPNGDPLTLLGEYDLMNTTGQ